MERKQGSKVRDENDGVINKRRQEKKKRKRRSKKEIDAEAAAAAAEKESRQMAAVAAASANQHYQKNMAALRMQRDQQLAAMGSFYGHPAAPAQAFNPYMLAM